MLTFVKGCTVASYLIDVYTKVNPELVAQRYQFGKRCSFSLAVVLPVIYSVELANYARVGKLTHTLC